MSAKIFDSSVALLQRNMDVRLSGSYNCIPFPESLSRLRTMIPGLQKSNYVIVTANSGVAKSKFAKYFYVLCPHDFILQHPEAGMKLDTMYFCLEEPKVRFVNTLICNRLYTRFGIRMDVKQLESINHERYLDAETLEKVNEMRDYFYELEDHLQIIDDIRNPTGIYKYAEKFIERHGTWSKKFIDIEENGVVTPKEVNDTFTYTHPNHYIQIVVDHKSLISTEKGLKDLHASMGHISSNYFVRLRNKLHASITSVQQQAAAQEKQQWTTKGNAIEDKLEPSLDGLGDNKTTQRDADEIIGVFSPIRYKILNHRNYNIAKLRDNYRAVSILKCRYGSPDLQTGMYFDGAVDYFEQLPKHGDMTEEIYNLYIRKAGRAPRVANTYDFSEA